LFVGKRSDPFFADAEGLMHGFQWTGKDTFAGSNILSIALEVPNDMLGRTAVNGAWMSVRLRRDGTWVQMDRGGNPSFNPILNPDDIKDEWNATDPVDDVDNYLKTLSGTLEAKGYPHDEAVAAALTLLPDILHYDRTKPAHYPNGRVMTDDVFSMRMAFLTYGKVTSDGLKPHEDLQTVFPFLGVPVP
jgi:hypothetical protein